MVASDGTVPSQEPVAREPAPDASAVGGTDAGGPPPRRDDRANWAGARDRLAADAAAGRDAVAVDGRRVSGPVQGFGKLWQKTFRVRLDGSEASPAEVITRWKERYGEFWPDNAQFTSPLAGVAPGEVALISDRTGGVRLSTGVLVLYADDESFSFITPEGHPFAGLITFSADRGDDGVTSAQVQLLLRAHDPMMEIGMVFGGHRKEERMWRHTLTALAASFDVTAPDVDATTACIDRHRQWGRFGNLRHDAALMSVMRPFRRRPPS